MGNKKKVLFLAVFVAILMVMSTAVVLSPAYFTSKSGVNSSAATYATGTQGNFASPALSQKASSIMQNLQSLGVPSNYVYLPSFKAPRIGQGGITGPSYTSAPAPMGIGTYGFSNVSGVRTKYTLNTSSFEGSVTFNNFSTFYPLDDGPNSVTVQLNSVLSNVTLFGVSNYTFWNQNVLFFSARTHTIQFIDNIWNFSSPAFYLSSNVFNSTMGNQVGNIYYYAIGPIFYVTYPFTVDFYLNSTVMGGENTVFFNYTVVNSTGSYTGTFDKVQFNSTYGMPSGYSAPQANYLVTSQYVTPTGFIPYDSEIMIGGPGGGSTAMVYGINATMTLKYWDSGIGGVTHQYANVPSAYDVGSETGETSTGIAVTWTPDEVAHLQAGPSFVYGMWNVSQVGTFEQFSGSVDPPNSFMFVSQGAPFSAANSTWTPLSVNGQYSFSLPSGSYGYSILMSNRNPVSGVLKAGTAQNTELVTNFAMGVYTPLYAFGNDQLKYISYCGDGTLYYPYVIYRNPAPGGMLDPLFSTFNDYVFPQFSGVLLHGTTAHVLMYHMPSFSVQYQQPFQLSALAYFGVQYTTNDIGYVLYETQNVTLAFSYISGWFANTLSEFPVANLLLWNSQNNFIFGNYFNTMDSALLIYNDNGFSGNAVIYNFFVQDKNLNEYSYYGIAVSTTFGTSPYGPVAMTVYSSGNCIHANFVIVYDTAVSPFYSIYSGAGATYINNWNGNFWWNYQPHSGVYNNSGQIAYGGDYHPFHFEEYNYGHFKHLVTNFLRA